MAARLGSVPNVDRFGQARNVFYSPNLYSSASAAEEALRIGRLNPLGATESPRWRIEVDPARANWRYAGNVEGGTGIEMLTDRALRVISVEELLP